MEEEPKIFVGNIDKIAEEYKDWIHTNSSVEILDRKLVMGLHPCGGGAFYTLLIFYKNGDLQAV